MSRQPDMTQVLSGEGGRTVFISTAELSVPVEGFRLGGSQCICMPEVNLSDYSAVKESKN